MIYDDVRLWVVTNNLHNWWPKKNIEFEDCIFSDIFLTDSPVASCFFMVKGVVSRSCDQVDCVTMFLTFFFLTDAHTKYQLESLSLAPFSRLLMCFYKYGSFCGRALPLVEQPIFVYYKNKLREDSTEREILRTICQKQALYLNLEVCQWWRKKLATSLPGGLIQTLELFPVIMWSS